MSKSKCTKHLSVGPLLEVEMSKKCTPLWREAHFEVKNVQKHLSVGPLLEVEMSKKCTPLWREAHFEVKMYKNTSASDHFWKLRCRKRCTPLWREAHFEVKMYKTHQVRTIFGSCAVEKVHAVVARKHISKSKCTIHLSLGPLLEVEMSKKCTPLWREAHFQVKMYKIPQPRTTFGS